MFKRNKDRDEWDNIVGNANKRYIVACEKKRIIKELHDTGYPAEDIASILNISESEVRFINGSNELCGQFMDLGSENDLIDILKASLDISRNNKRMSNKELARFLVAHLSPIIKDMYVKNMLKMRHACPFI